MLVKVPGLHPSQPFLINALLWKPRQQFSSFQRSALECGSGRSSVFTIYQSQSIHPSPHKTQHLNNANVQATPHNRVSLDFDEYNPQLPHDGFIKDQFGINTLLPKLIIAVSALG